jgi:hypothetical protein
MPTKKEQRSFFAYRFRRSFWLRVHTVEDMHVKVVYVVAINETHAFDSLHFFDYSNKTLFSSVLTQYQSVRLYHSLLLKELCCI